jgi:O-antigen biosynthesis protein WbqP
MTRQRLDIDAGKRRRLDPKRLFDITCVLIAFAVFAIPMLVLALMVRLTSKGPVLYWSDRVGQGNVIFRMPKFRTMRVNTPALATHLLTSPEAYLTPVGGLLRRTSLDELPQLWSVLRGDMSFVGPRPALFNQDDLIALRTAEGVHLIPPGLTGWAQINGRDELAILDKVELDVEYLRRRAFGFDLRILFLTAVRAVRGDGVSH